MNISTNEKMKLVKSINLCKSVTQMSYDIVKAHGGKIMVDTMEAKGTEFTIYLPFQ